MVNIIIPVYKARKTLPAALDSLVAQTKKMFIVTLSIDGDGEDYSDIIKEYEKRGLHINIINGDNGGPGVARQRGIDANYMCDYIMFLDADDMLFPNAVDTLYTEAKRAGVDVLSSDFLAEHKYESNRIMDVMNIPVTWHHGKIYRAQYLRENNIRFREDMTMNEDAYFNLIAINCTENKLKLQEPTYFWRYNKNSITRKGTYIDFFKKAWDQYVFGQIKALQEIIRIKGDIDSLLLAATLINIYKWIMIAINLKYDTSKVKSYVAELREIPKIIEKIDDYDFWVYIHNNLKASEYIEEKFIFFSIRFSDWVRTYIKGE